MGRLALSEEVRAAALSVLSDEEVTAQQVLGPSRCVPARRRVHLALVEWCKVALVCILASPCCSHKSSTGCSCVILYSFVTPLFQIAGSQMHKASQISVQAVERQLHKDM